MKKAVIFDLDGTLVNSIPFHLRKHKVVFDSLGINLENDYFETKCNGSSQPEFYRRALTHYTGSDKLFNKAQKKRKEVYQGSDLAEIKVFSGVKSTLAALKKAGFKIAVASSSRHSYVQEVLDNNGITKYFDTIVGGNEVTKSKPAPHIFLLACQHLCVKKADCVIIEDATNGVLAAKNAKMDCLCLLTSEKPEDIPLAMDAKYLMKSIRDKYNIKPTIVGQ